MCFSAVMYALPAVPAASFAARATYGETHCRWVERRRRSRDTGDFVLAGNASPDRFEYAGCKDSLCEGRQRDRLLVLLLEMVQDVVPENGPKGSIERIRKAIDLLSVSNWPSVG